VAPANGVYTKLAAFIRGFIYEPAGGTYHFKFTRIMPTGTMANMAMAVPGNLSADGF